MLKEICLNRLEPIQRRFMALLKRRRHAVQNWLAFVFDQFLDALFQWLYVNLLKYWDLLNRGQKVISLPAYSAKIKQRFTIKSPKKEMRSTSGPLFYSQD
jgi:hypothetical protein